MASPTQWTWVWVNSRNWWWTGKPGMLQSMRWQRVRHNWATELNWAKAMICPVVTYGCESWTIRKAEHWRFDAFELWWWRRLLRVPWTARRSNQSILKEISPSVHCKDWCRTWSSNTLATWCEELTHLKRPWWWEKLEAGEEGTTEDKMVGWHHWLNGHEFE